MKLTNNSTTAKYLKARMLADFDDSKLKALPLQYCFWFRFKRYQLPKSIRDITFKMFWAASYHLESDFAMCEFLELTTNVNKKIFNRLKISLSLPLYAHYKSEFIEILNSFKYIGDEAPKAKVIVKDMQGFGLLPYIDYLAGGDMTKFKEIENMLVHEILSVYTLKVHQNINAYANAKADVKSN